MKLERTKKPFWITNLPFSAVGVRCKVDEVTVLVGAYHHHNMTCFGKTAVGDDGFQAGQEIFDKGECLSVVHP